MDGIILVHVPNFPFRKDRVQSNFVKYRSSNNKRKAAIRVGHEENAYWKHNLEEVKTIENKGEYS